MGFGDGKLVDWLVRWQFSMLRDACGILNPIIVMERMGFFPIVAMTLIYTDGICKLTRIVSLAQLRSINHRQMKLAQVYFCMVTELLGDSLYDFLKWNGYRGYWLQEILSFFFQNRKSIFCSIVLIIRKKTDDLPDLPMIGQRISQTI